MRYICTTVVVIFLFAGLLPAALPPPGTSAKIFVPRNFPGWQSQNVVCPFVFQESDETYKMYYSGSGSEQWNDSNWDQWMTGYATSTDTLTWKVPDNYEQVLFARRCMEGDLLDPLQMAAVFDSVYAVGPCIIKDGSVYKVWYTGWNGETVHLGGGLTDKINFRIGYATSPDGIKWTKVSGNGGAGAVLGLGAAGEPDAKGSSYPYVLKEDGNYRMWYEGYDGTARRIMYTTSPDGINWTGQTVALDKGGSGAKDELGLRNPMVIRRKNKYELWYQGRSTASPNYHILRATSTNGLTWTKQTAEVALHPDSPLSGSENIHVDSAIVQPDDSVQVFFAKETTSPRTVVYCIQLSNNCFSEVVGQNRNYSIYTEVVNP